MFDNNNASINHNRPTVKVLTPNRNWYEPSAFLLGVENSSIFINLLVGLETVSFNLSVLDPTETASTDLYEPGLDFAVLTFLGKLYKLFA